MSDLFKSLNLPPQTKGRSLGTLEFSINSINWKKRSKFNGVNAVIIWWGQSIKTGTAMKFPQTNTIQYNITCNSILFNSYLSSCDPIQIRFFSAISNLDIGTSIIELPNNGINPNDTTTKKIVCNNTEIIYHKENIGSIDITIEVKFNSVTILKDKTVKNVLKDALHSFVEMSHQVNNYSIEDGLKRLFTNKCDKENIYNTEKPFNKLKKSDQSSIIEYLTGCPMTIEEEIYTLKKIRSVSPTGSLLNMINKYSESIPHEQVTFNNDINLLNKIDSIKITLGNLFLTKSGIKNIHKFYEEQPTVSFLIECTIDKKFNNIDNNNCLIRFYSSYIDDLCDEIPFDVDIVKRIKFPKNYKSLSLLQSFITFKIYWTADGHPNLKLFSSHQIKIVDILNKYNLSYNSKCLFESKNKRKVLSEMFIEIKFGVNSQHFGDDFLDYVNSLNQESKMTPIECNRDRQETTNNISASSTPQPMETNNSNSLNAYYSGNNSNNDNIEETNKTDVDLLPSDTKPLTELYVLLYINNMQLNDKNKYYNNYLTSVPFWSNNNETIKYYENTNNNYLQIIPIKFTNAILEKCKHSYMLIDFWKESNENSNGLSKTQLGYVRLQLHPFYVAYNNDDITQYLSRTTLPVISYDGNINILKTTSNEIIGDINITLVAGFKHQIDHFTAIKNLSQYHLIQENNTKIETNNPQAPIMNFIDNLTRTLPTKCSITSTDNIGSSKPSLSNLMEILQNSFDNKSSLVNNFPQVPKDRKKVFKVLVEINSAMHLKGLEESETVNKKVNKRVSVATQLNTYATFEALNLLPNNTTVPITLKTQTIDNSCSPIWKKSYKVYLPCDMITAKNDNQHFNVQLWNQNSSEQNKTKTAGDDVLLGFVSIDLSVLLTGIPTLSGWYKIMNLGKCHGEMMISIVPLEDVVKYNPTKMFMEKMQPTTTPLHVDVGLPTVQLPMTPGSLNATVLLKANDENQENHDIINFDVLEESSNASLSRAFKRKFTELEEITQRLRARLNNVTSSIIIDHDEDDEFDLNEDKIDDDFEKDLNTVCYDDDFDTGANNTNDYGWLNLANPDDKIALVNSEDDDNGKNKPSCSYTLDTNNK